MLLVLLDMMESVTVMRVDTVEMEVEVQELEVFSEGVVLHVVIQFLQVCCYEMEKQMNKTKSVCSVCTTGLSWFFVALGLSQVGVACSGVSKF